MRWTLLVMLGLGALGCGDDGGGGGGPDGPLADACPACQSESRVGASSLVALTQDQGPPPYSSVAGAAFAAPPPTVYATVAERGGCRWLGYDASACTTPCDFGQFCAAGTCQAFPEATDIGPLTLTGARAAPVTLTAQLGGGYQWAEEGALAEPAVTLATSDGVVAAASITVTAPAPIQPAHDWSQAMEARSTGADVTLRWQAPDPGARVYLRMTTCVGTHGGVSPVEVECDVADGGEVTLPGDHLDALYADGWGRGECGVNEVYRYRAGRADVGAAAPLVFAAQTRTSFYYYPRLGSNPTAIGAAAPYRRGRR